MPEPPKTRRLFLALWPDDPVRQALTQATSEAVRKSGGRPVPPTNFHITLVFLGSVTEVRLPAVISVASGASFAAFELLFDQIEHWRKPAVLCAVPSTYPNSARQLAQTLHNALTAQGFLLDPKPWRPHVTLARKVTKPEFTGAIEPIPWLANDIALVESQILPEGSHYTVLQRWPSLPNADSPDS